MINFRQPDVENFFQTFGIQTFTVNKEETQLVFSTNLNGKYNLWAMDLPNAFPYPLSFHNQSCSELAYDKQGRYILAVMDQDGDENGQIYAVPPKGGSLEPLRTHEGARHMGLNLSKDGERLYYTSTKEDQTYLKSYCYDLKEDAEKVIHEGKDAATYLAAKSPDEQAIVYVKHYANTYVLAFVKKDGQEVYLTPDREEQHTVSGVEFVSDHLIYFTTNYGEDFSYLARFNLEDESFEKVAAIEKEEFDDVYYDQSSNSLYIRAEKGVKDKLYQFDLKEEKLNGIDIPTTEIAGLKVADSGNLYLAGRTAVRPANIYMRKDGQWKQLTKYNVPGVKEEEMAEPELHTYKSFDGLEIEAQFFKAKPENSNGHVILWPHGGPQAAERATFRSLFQFLVYRGYSIFTPNFRGSTGYGLKFSKMVEGDWGHGPRLDNIEGLEYLFKKGLADRDKVLLMGGSYGGYMALLLHGRHADYFKAVVDIFGPCNLFSFIESVPEHWKPVMKQWVGDPVEDKEKLTEDSPIEYLDSMTKPMFVIQGAKDPRVVKAESDQIVEALKGKGREVKYLVLDDEGHGFSKKANEMRVYEEVLAFFDEYIK
ncbi:S9 family peptidase [Jeotgalibacillus haloalkalitolerans]|uniref:S9 family peptidase n=1 Tax=Jeotgalibacillus haloalkalitolerans TaxID=3104292 RepID=A0ABU5KI40_9BACL|nr:S9 family peptidase [Jeotgalibacillus sp. HH7-29]MDZ5710899.1 S9 family peptidase [Jeotgalibacillus sp. HH7-29]